MKHILLITLIFLSLTATAQRIRFTDNTNVWTIYVTEPLSTVTYPRYHYSYCYYEGSTVIDGMNYFKLSYGDYYRDDTVNNKVFTRKATDTADRLLYDYNWQVNDTVIWYNSFSTIPDTAWVHNIDSTMINGNWYKVWHFWCNLGIHIHSNPIYFNVIEGVGCTNFFSPVHGFDQANQLQCFSNNGVQPALSTLIPSYGPDYSPTMYFNNTDHCPALGVGIGPIKAKDVIVSPNPVNERTRIVFPYTIKSGTLVVTNVVGQVVLRFELEDANEVAIGSKLPENGIYFYRVTDLEQAATFTGKLVQE
jgi:hypothetical protein